MDNNKSAGAGISGLFGTLLAIVFITLKLLGKIAWPWVWVLSPIWIPAALGCLYLIGFIIFVAIVSHNN